MAGLNIEIADLVAKTIEKIGSEGFFIGKWIPCSDRLPEIGQNVLIYAVGKEKCYESTIVITKMSDTIWFGHEVKTEPYWKDPWQYFHSDYEITHWMPLPEPPEIEKKKGSKNNGCWITCGECANTSCQNRDETEVKQE